MNAWLALDPLRQMAVAAGLLLAVVALLVACWRDARERLIPNRISLFLLLIYPPTAWAAGAAPASMGWHLLAGLGLFAVLAVMFFLGWLGGGDVKLSSAVAVWFGWPQLVVFLVVSGVVGGLLAVSVLVLRRPWMPARVASHPWVTAITLNEHGIPYGIALALGAIGTFAWLFKKNIPIW